MNTLRNLMIFAPLWLGLMACQNDETSLSNTPKEAAIDPQQLPIDGVQLLNAAYASEQGNPQALDAAVLDLGETFADAAAQSLAMSTTEKAALDSLLRTESPQIANQLRQEYLRNISTLSVADSSVISREFSTRADVLTAALNATTCSFSSLVFLPMGISLSLPTAIGASYAMQSPCEQVLQPIMARVGEKIHKAGIVRDVEITTTRLTLHKQSLLAEIAVADMVMEVQVGHQIRRKFSLFGRKLADWRAAQVNIQYNAHLKYGFDLSSELKVSFDEQAQRIVILLAEPQLLSCALDPVLTDIEDGGIADIDAAVLRSLYDEAQQKAILLADQRGITAMSKRNAQLFFELLFAPFTADFQIQVQFSNQPSTTTQS